MQPLDESLRYQSIAHLQNTESYPLDEPLTVKQKLMKKGPMTVTYFNFHEKEDAISEQHGTYFDSAVYGTGAFRPVSVCCWLERGQCDQRRGCSKGVARFFAWYSGSGITYSNIDVYDNFDWKQLDFKHFQVYTICQPCLVIPCRAGFLLKKAPITNGTRWFLWWGIVQLYRISFDICEYYIQNSAKRWKIY